MVLSDTTGNGGLLEDAKFLAGNPPDFTDADIKRYLNLKYLALQTIIMDSMDSVDFAENTGLISLVADTRSYNWPTGLLRIKRVEITFDGTNYVEALPIDKRNIEGTILTDDTQIKKSYSNSQPYFVAHNEQIEILSGPIIAVTNGIKVWFEKIVDELSLDADEPKVAKPFHQIISMDAVEMWAVKNDKFTLAGSLRKISGEYNELTGHYSGLKGQMQSFYSNRLETRKPAIRSREVNYE